MLLENSSLAATPLGALAGGRRNHSADWARTANHTQKKRGTFRTGQGVLSSGKRGETYRMPYGARGTRVVPRVWDKNRSRTPPLVRCGAGFLSHEGRHGTSRPKIIKPSRLRQTDNLCCTGTLPSDAAADPRSSAHRGGPPAPLPGRTPCNAPTLLFTPEGGVHKLGRGKAGCRTVGLFDAPSGPRGCRFKNERRKNRRSKSRLVDKSSSSGPDCVRFSDAAVAGFTRVCTELLRKWCGMGRSGHIGCRRYRLTNLHPDPFP